MAAASLALLVLDHEVPERLAILAERLRHPRISLHLHVDGRVSIQSFVEAVALQPQMRILDQRERVEWGGLSQVRAMTALLRAFLDSQASHFYFLSGSCFPLHDAQTVLDRLTRAPLAIEFEPASQNPWITNEVHRRLAYYWFGPSRGMVAKALFRLQHGLTLGRGLRRPGGPWFFGSSWLGGDRRLAEALIEWPDQIGQQLSNSLCSDELAFPTIVGRNSELAVLPNAGKCTFSDFRTGPDYPRWLTFEDYESLRGGQWTFARKFRLQTIRRIASEAR